MEATCKKQATLAVPAYRLQEQRAHFVKTCLRSLKPNVRRIKHATHFNCLPARTDQHTTSVAGQKAGRALQIIL